MWGTSRKQRQNAGNDSQQLQINGDATINNGPITEETAKAVVQSFRESTALAGMLAQTLLLDRIDRFDDPALTRLGNAGLLHRLADPAFQRTYRLAQVAAGSTDSEEDYDLLARLVEERARADQDRIKATSIQSAVTMIDRMDPKALTAITVIHGFLRILPGPFRMLENLEQIALYVRVLRDERELPEGSEWIEHLDDLGAVRINTVTTFKPLEQIVHDKAPALVAVGVLRDSEELEKIDARLTSILGPGSWWMDHELKPGYARLVPPHPSFLERFAENQPNEAALKAAEAFLKSETPMLSLDAQLVDPFNEAISTFRALADFREWWNNLSPYFSLASPGVQIANINRSRLDTDGILPVE